MVYLGVSIFLLNKLMNMNTNCLNFETMLNLCLFADHSNNKDIKINRRRNKNVTPIELANMDKLQNNHTIGI